MCTSGPLLFSCTWDVIFSPSSPIYFLAWIASQEALFFVLSQFVDSPAVCQYNTTSEKLTTPLGTVSDMKNMYYYCTRLWLEHGSIPITRSFGGASTTGSYKLS
jgi:hypothetical protein